MQKIAIKGVQINLNNLTDVKSQKSLKATDIFSHLSNEEQVEAYSELWLVLKPEEKVTPPLAQEAAIAAASGEAVSAE